MYVVLSSVLARIADDTISGRRLLVLPTAFSRRYNSRRKINEPKYAITGSGGSIPSHPYKLEIHEVDKRWVRICMP